MRTIQNILSPKRALLVGLVLTLLLLFSIQIGYAGGLSQTIPTAPPSTVENPTRMPPDDTIQPKVTTTLTQPPHQATATPTKKTSPTGSPEKTNTPFLTLTAVASPSSGSGSLIYYLGGGLVLIGLIFTLILIRSLRRKKKSKEKGLPAGPALLP